MLKHTVFKKKIRFPTKWTIINEIWHLNRAPSIQKNHFPSYFSFKFCQRAHVLTRERCREREKACPTGNGRIHKPFSSVSPTFLNFGHAHTLSVFFKPPKSGIQTTQRALQDPEPHHSLHHGLAYKFTFTKQLITLQQQTTRPRKHFLAQLPSSSSEMLRNVF